MPTVNSDRSKPYNPLDKRNLGDSVAEALLQSKLRPLPPPESFTGAGVYVLYYTGNYPLYRPIAKRNKNNKYELPIYAGKAVPAGARRGGGTFEDYTGTALFSRLREHADSIRQTGNLRVEDFRCRYLVVDDIWIPLGENLVINTFVPLWNKVVDGFGNHDPGSGRSGQQSSPWDTLHPGRTWATKLPAYRLSAEEIGRAVKKYCDDLPTITLSPAVS